LDSDLTDEAGSAAMDEDLGVQSPFDEGDAGDGFDEAIEAADDADAASAADFAEEDGFAADEFDMAEGEADGTDDMAVWNAFEEEIADGLDAADGDEFLGRLLGGLGRAAPGVWQDRSAAWRGRYRRPPTRRRAWRACWAHPAWPACWGRRAGPRRAWAASPDVPGAWPARWGRRPAAHKACSAS
jgi:hypothetical protein